MSLQLGTSPNTKKHIIDLTKQKDSEECLGEDFFQKLSPFFFVFVFFCFLVLVGCFSDCVDV